MVGVMEALYPALSKLNCHQKGLLYVLLHHMHCPGQAEQTDYGNTLIRSREFLLTADAKCVCRYTHTCEMGDKTAT